MIVLFPPEWNQVGEFINNYVTPLARFVQAGETSFRHRPFKQHSRDLILASFPTASHSFDVTEAEEKDRTLKEEFWSKFHKLRGANVNSFSRQHANESPELEGRVLLVQRGTQGNPRKRGFKDAEATRRQIEELLGYPVDVESFETYTLAKQAEIIHSYKYIIVTHGAAMCYIRLFHRKGAIVYHLATPFAPLHAHHPKPHSQRDWALGYNNNGLTIRNIECMLYDMTLQSDDRASKYSDCLPVNQSLMRYYDPSTPTITTLTGVILHDIDWNVSLATALRADVARGGHLLLSLHLETFENLVITSDGMKINDYDAASGVPAHGYLRHKDVFQSMRKMLMYSHDKRVLLIEPHHMGVKVNGTLYDTQRGMLTITLVDPAEQRTIR